MNGAIEKCSCAEAAHLRVALKTIKRIATGTTDWTPVDDLAQIGNVAAQALRLEPLGGDPSIGAIAPFLPRAR